ncbi:MAG: hypothetical protein CMJ46_01350 [Planctomyces sp.]|nr:hypothetical protein [Planctomyces sp.]
MERRLKPSSIKFGLLAAIVILTFYCDRSLFAKTGLTYRLQCRVVTPLEYPNTPLDPLIDFSKWISTDDSSPLLDPASIEVIDVTTGMEIPHSLSAEFHYGNSGRVRWVAKGPEATEYEIRFRTTEKRAATLQRESIPRVGIGDLLHYNATTPRPVTTFYAATLVDLNNDGKSDLAGCWNYAYAPEETWNGVIAHLRRDQATGITVGERIQLRFQHEDDETSFHFFDGTYQSCDFADLNGDDLIDLVQTERTTRQARFFLNTGKFEPTGLPVYQLAGSVPIDGWNACRIVDLDNNGTLDLIIDGQFISNSNPDGWPFEASAAVPLDAGKEPDFLDLNGDHKIDAVILVPNHEDSPDGHHLAWCANFGDNQPKFGPPQSIDEISADYITGISATADGETRGLLVQHDVYQRLTFFPLTDGTDRNRFGTPRNIVSPVAPLSLSDQAWPCFCDWDDDGDLDLLVGGGYGWPRIIINEGSSSAPSYSEPQLILAEGKPIRFVRNELLGDPPSSHNMGYTYPSFVDWNGDDLPDLMLPNETNRIFWYANIGSREAPDFGPPQQLLVDGFPDSTELRKLSANRAIEKNPNGVYPQEPERPFYWRTGAAFADWNDDGLMDFITASSMDRRATLFVQYRTAADELKLRKEMEVTLTDGRPVDDRLVKRRSHWTESYRAVDWNRDGKLDLLYSLAGAHGGIQDGGSMYLLINSGTKARPRFEPPVTMKCFGEPIRITNHGPHPWVGDLDHDGFADLVPCVEWSVYPFYSHAALRMTERPRVEIKNIVD